MATLYVLTLERSTGWAGGDGRNTMSIIWPKSAEELREIENTRDLTGTESQDLRIRENMQDIDWDDMTFEEFEDMFEDRDPTEFL